MSTHPGAPAAGEHPAGAADAERLAQHMREATPARSPKAPAGKKKPGRPARPVRPRITPTVEEEGAEEFDYAAERAVAQKELLSLSENLAAIRGRRLLEDDRTPEQRLVDAYTLSKEQALVAADAWAMVRRKYLPASDERPELRLLWLLLPWLIGVIRAEFAYYLHARAHRAAATEAGGERGAVRPEGERKDHAREEYLTKPFTLPGH